MKPALRGWIAIVFLGAASQVLAADVGRVLLAAGETLAVRDKQIIKLVFGSTVQDKDLLRTGPASNLQVRFIDESILSMRENSEIRIDEFRFTGKEDGTERAFFNLLKGGLRKITGIIGRTNHNNYKMDSVVATIGIRGTDYAATLCQQDCYSNPSHKLAPDGLYGRVIGASFGTNRKVVTNQTGPHVFGIRENYYVADAATVPQRLLEPPGFLYVAVKSKISKPPAGTGNEQAAAGGAQGDSRTDDPFAPPVTPPQPSTPPVIGEFDSSVTPTIGAVGAYIDASGQAQDGGAYITPSMVTLNASGVVTGFNIPAGTTEVDGGTISPPGVIGAASSVAESGSADPGDGSINARWARWGSTLTDDTGTSMLPGGFHGMIGNLAPPEVVAAKTGTFSFAGVGGTTPTNSLGETATSFGYPSLSVNFTTRQASLGAFSWTFPSNFWSFPSGSANVFITPGKGAGIEGLNTGGSCSSGPGGCGYPSPSPATLGVTGIFYGPKGDHLGGAFAAQSGSAGAMGVKLYTCSSSC